MSIASLESRDPRDLTTDEQSKIDAWWFAHDATSCQGGDGHEDEPTTIVEVPGSDFIFARYCEECAMYAAIEETQPH